MDAPVDPVDMPVELRIQRRLGVLVDHLDQLVGIEILAPSGCMPSPSVTLRRTMTRCSEPPSGEADPAGSGPCQKFLVQLLEDIAVRVSVGVPALMIATSGLAQTRVVGILGALG